MSQHAGNPSQFARTNLKIERISFIIPIICTQINAMTTLQLALIMDYVDWTQVGMFFVYAMMNTKENSATNMVLLCYCHERKTLSSNSP